MGSSDVLLCYTTVSVPGAQGGCAYTTVSVPGAPGWVCIHHSECAHTMVSVPGVGVHTPW